MADWATEELFFTMHDMGGNIWEARDLYSKWDPAAHVGEWKTPQLVIHSELDYRLPVSEGLAAFNALQVREVESRLLVFPDENHVSACSFCFPCFCLAAVPLNSGQRLLTTGILSPCSGY